MTWYDRRDAADCDWNAHLRIRHHVHSWPAAFHLLLLLLLPPLLLLLPPLSPQPPFPHFFTPLPHLRWRFSLRPREINFDLIVGRFVGLLEKVKRTKRHITDRHSTCEEWPEEKPKIVSCFSLLTTKLALGKPFTWINMYPNQNWTLLHADTPSGKIAIGQNFFLAHSHFLCFLDLGRQLWYHPPVICLSSQSSFTTYSSCHMDNLSHFLGYR